MHDVCNMNIAGSLFPSSDDDSDSSELGGFQLSWQEGGFTRRTPLNCRGVGGAAVQHPPEASPGMYFEMFWTVAMWLHLVTETNRYADQERQRKPPPPPPPSGCPCPPAKWRHSSACALRWVFCVCRQEMTTGGKPSGFWRLNSARWCQEIGLT